MTRFARHPATVVIATALLSSLAAQAAPVDPAAAQFQAWRNDTDVSRELLLRDLGIDKPLVLSGQSSQRDIYLPVPAGIATRDATLQLDGRYVRGHGGRSSGLWSIDGDPVAARPMTDTSGDASQTIAIDGLPRAGGFVRIGVGWWSVVSEQRCADQSAPANVLRLSPDSRFSYRFDARAIDSVDKALSALPPKVRILVADKQLGDKAFDAAWRVGTVLQGNGKRVEVLPLPQVGASVDLRGITVPAALRGIPAFAALGGGEPAHRIADAAELGALLSLPGNSPVAADVVIDDAPLRSTIHAALDALAQQMAAADGDAALAFSAWRAAGLAALEQGPGTASIRVVTAAGRPVLQVAETAGTQVAGLLSRQWRNYAHGQALQVDKAVQPDAGKDDVVALERLGSMAGTLDVTSRSDRSISFPLGALAADGRLPDTLVFDLSAAPDAAGKGAVATLFFNDYLLGAANLSPDGKPQRIEARIPAYALAARNEIRISLLRQPSRPYCHDPATAYPVSILPSSHLRLAKRDLGVNFVAATGALSQASDVFIPRTWLGDAPAALGKVIAVASAVGVAPEHARLQLVAAGTAIRPEQPYLAFGVAPAGANLAAAQGGRLVVSAHAAPVLDLRGIEHAAAVQVIDAGGQLGVVYNDLGARAPRLDAPFQLLRGDVALLGDGGSISQFDSTDPHGATLATEGNPQPWWQQHMVWLLLIVGLVVFALLAARVAQVRRRRQSARQAH